MVIVCSFFLTKGSKEFVLLYIARESPFRPMCSEVVYKKVELRGTESTSFTDSFILPSCHQSNILFILYDIDLFAVFLLPFAL